MPKFGLGGRMQGGGCTFNPVLSPRGKQGRCEKQCVWIYGKIKNKNHVPLCIPEHRQQSKFQICLKISKDSCAKLANFGDFWIKFPKFFKMILNVHQIVSDCFSDVFNVFDVHLC